MRKKDMTMTSFLPFIIKILPLVLCLINPSDSELGETSEELREISAGIRKLTDVVEGTCSGGDDYYALEERVAFLESRIGLLTASSNSEPVFFNAYSSRAISCSDGCDVTYTRTFGDSHNALSVNTGVFTCPKSGHYFFQFHALVESGHEARVIVLVNETPTLYLYDRDHSGSNGRYSMIGQSLIYSLTRGDEVVVRLNKGALKGGGTHPFTSFLGILIQESHKEIDQNKVPKSLFR